MESFLNFCLSGVRHVQRFYPHAELVSIRAGTRDGQAVRVPQLLKAVTLDLNPDARDSRSEKLLSISSNALGQWGEVEVLGREVVGLAHYYLDDPSRPPMIDLLEAFRLFAAAGYEFYFDHITLEKPVFRDAEEEYYYFTSVSEDLKIGVGARSGRIAVYRGEGSGRVSRLSRRRSEADIERSIERSRSRSLERRQSRSNQALVQNINTAVRIVGERYPGARLLTVKALKKELAPALDVVKYHVTFQYNAGHVDIFSSSRWGEWGVPVFTEGRLPHWHNVPFSVDSEDVGDGTEWVVRAKL